MSLNPCAICGGLVSVQCPKCLVMYDPHMIHLCAGFSYEDPINPEHYKNGSLETIEVIKGKLSSEEFKGYLRGNIVKYVLRSSLKGGLEDLQKAQWYLNYWIKEVESGALRA